MGIQGLSRLIADVAPGAVKENEIKNYFGESLSSLRFHACIHMVYLCTDVTFVVRFTWRSYPS